nr:MAG TPA: hypothetical protein [Caudoviricetes sp.]DAT07317.1 MAG TPA: hypothetical protein [Caudoviricetes sp.]
MLLLQTPYEGVMSLFPSIYQLSKNNASNFIVGEANQPHI